MVGAGPNMVRTWPAVFADQAFEYGGKLQTNPRKMKKAKNPRTKMTTTVLDLVLVFIIDD
jgi:hypothetical protein